MKVLFFGDIVGRIGRNAVTKVIPELKKEYNPDIIIANAENASHGSGISKKNLQEMIDAGIDFFTSGNHIWKRKESLEILQDQNSNLIRPANYPFGVVGNGYKHINIGKKSLIVINLQGRVFLPDHIDCPFRSIDHILKECKNIKTDGILIDFHAEATSEKQAMARYVDGRVSALIGTHTHIATADMEVLEKGTGYITDAGACYAKNSVIGVSTEVILKRFLEQVPHSFEYPEQGICNISAIYLEIDDFYTKDIKHIAKEINVL